MAGGELRRRINGRRRCLIEPEFEDLVQRAIRHRASGVTTLGGRFETRCAEALPQRHEAEACAIALFRMRFVFEDVRHDRTRCDAD